MHVSFVNTFYALKCTRCVSQGVFSTGYSMLKPLCHIVAATVHTAVYYRHNYSHNYLQK